MAGDDNNDAPAPARADICFAMGVAPSLGRVSGRGYKVRDKPWPLYPRN